MEEKEKKEREDKLKNRFELLFGVLIAFFAAALAIVDLGAGKYGDDELKAVNEKSAAYQWYQSKSIKQNLVEGQRDLLNSLLEAKVINTEDTAALEKYVSKLEKKVKKYDKEKFEILEGSSKVGKENWVQEKDGEMGKIIGAKEVEIQAEKLSDAGDIFDFATLYLQIGLVMGAIGLVLQNRKTKLFFLGIMLTLGVLGIIYGIMAYNIAWSI
ncbi:MAG: DUF4337 family protein [Bacteroidota bacterium]